MKTTVNITIVGILFVIASMLAWPYIHDTYIRGTKAYQLDARYCNLGIHTALLSGNPFAGTECHALINRKYGLGS